MAKLIMLVDDDVDILESSQIMLRLEGMNVITAIDGEQAIQIYKKNEPCLVFMDIWMPKKDGFEAFNEIKNQDHNAKVIFVTGHQQDENKLQDAKKKGLLDFVEKPLTFDTYMQLIRKFA